MPLWLLPCHRHKHEKNGAAGGPPELSGLIVETSGGVNIKAREFAGSLH